MDIEQEIAKLFSRSPDFNGGLHAAVGGLQRNQAVKALVAELVKQGRGRRT